MGTDRRTLTRWGLACGGPIVGSLAITGSLAIGIPTLLGGASPPSPRAVTAAPAVTTEPEAVAPTAPSAGWERSPPARRSEPPPRLRPRPLVTEVSAAVSPPPETAEWMDEEQQRLEDLERQQTNFAKTIVDMAHAAHGADTSMLTFEEISGGRSLRGRARFLARQAAEVAGGGGAPSQTTESDAPEEPAPAAAPTEAEPPAEEDSADTPDAEETAPGDGPEDATEGDTSPDSNETLESPADGNEGGQGSAD